MSGSCLCLGVSGVSGVHCTGDSELLELVTAQSSSEPEPETDQGGLREAADQSALCSRPRLDQSEAADWWSRDLCDDQSEARGVRAQSPVGGDQERSRCLTRCTWSETREARDTVTVAPPSIREAA